MPRPPRRYWTPQASELHPRDPKGEIQRERNPALRGIEVRYRGCCHSGVTANPRNDNQFDRSGDAFRHIRAYRCSGKLMLCAAASCPSMGFEWRAIRGARAMTVCGLTSWPLTRYGPYAEAIRLWSLTITEAMLPFWLCSRVWVCFTLVILWSVQP